MNKLVRRNAGNVQPTAPPRRRRTAMVRRAPDNTDLSTLGSTLASVLGGGGGALLGGLLANRGISPVAVAALMTVGGGLGAWQLKGNLGLAARGLASAGAGQLALALIGGSVEKPKEKPKSETSDSEGKSHSNAPALPPGALEAAFERARQRLAMDVDDEARYAEAIDVEYQEQAAA
jgi:hypothetical protein